MTLKAIGENRESMWDPKSVTEANGLLAQLKSAAFITAFQSCRYIFGYTKTLAVLLQGSEMNVITAYRCIEDVKKEVQDVRNDADMEFNPLFQLACSMAKSSDGEIAIPHCCGRQTFRNNVEGDTPEVYYRRSVFLPFIDSLLEQLSSRFRRLSSLATKALFLLPEHLCNISDLDATDILEFYAEDVPYPHIFKQELRLWKCHWSTEKEKPGTIELTLSNNSWNKHRFPNIYTILHVLLVTAVTSAGVERSKSVLRFVKNDYRSTMTEERMNALLMLFVHWDIALD